MASDRDYQIENLKRIFADASSSPVFKGNDKYPTEGVPRIAYSDVMDFKYNIRVDTEFDAGPSFWDEKTPVIVKYTSIEDLVDDGWRLD
jgi:hypothetical protein